MMGPRGLAACGDAGSTTTATASPFPLAADSAYANLPALAAAIRSTGLPCSEALLG
jgi:hypothetical protein